MSLTNADSYKNNREKRKKEAKKKKLLFRLKTALAAVIWIGYSGYQKIEENKPRASVTADYTAFDDYLSGLSNAEAAE